METVLFVFIRDAGQGSAGGYRIRPYGLRGRRHPQPVEKVHRRGEHCLPAEALRQPERCRAVGGTPPYDASISSPACTAAPSPKNAL